jgi:hypothetical protein
MNQEALLQLYRIVTGNQAGFRSTEREDNHHQYPTYILPNDDVPPSAGETKF